MSLFLFPLFFSFSFLPNFIFWRRKGGAGPPAPLDPHLLLTFIVFRLIFRTSFAVKSVSYSRALLYKMIILYSYSYSYQAVSIHSWNVALFMILPYLTLEPVLSRRAHVVRSSRHLRFSLPLSFFCHFLVAILLPFLSTYCHLYALDGLPISI